jgi:hypothetical protein
MKELIGKTFEEAKSIASSKGYYLRIVWQDDKIMYGTCDLDERRIEVYVQNNMIINPKTFI